MLERRGERGEMKRLALTSESGFDLARQPLVAPEELHTDLAIRLTKVDRFRSTGHPGLD
jgi:hypothetical protein